MKIQSFRENMNYGERGVATKVMLETVFSKEIRILLKKGQAMKEHKAPYPIIIHVLSGNIEFAVQGDVSQLSAGDIITLGADVPHNLLAQEKSMLRLSLSKHDQSERVEKLV